MTTIERNCTAIEAQSNFDNEIKRLGFASNITCLRDSSLLQGYSCVIHSADTQFSFVGVGKGFGEQSKLSAQFESLEHFTAIPSLTQTDIQIEFLSPREIQEQNLPVIRHKLPQGFFTQNNNYDCKLPCLLLQHISQPHQSHYAPLVCVNPGYLDFPYSNDKFAYESLYLHQASNGIAIGNNFTEAMIHAISEAIERDSYSLFIRQVLLENQAMDLVDLTSLPEKLLNAVNLIQKESGYKCVIIKAPSLVNIPVYIAFLLSPTLITPIKGLGCSLDENYALERAVLEVIEQYDFYEMGVREEEELAMEALKKYPRLYECAQFNLEKILQANNFNTLKFEKSLFTLSNLDAHLSELIERASTHYDIFATTLYSSPNVTTVKVELQQASDLFMIAKGILAPEAFQYISS